MGKTPKDIKTLGDVQRDALNANAHTERGRAMHEHSMRTYGFGRPIVVDRNGGLIAGEQTTDVAVDIGLDAQPPIVIRTRGDRVIIHQREDLDLQEAPAQAHGLALADNRVAEASIALQAAVVLQYEQEGVQLAGLYADAERATLQRLADAEAAAYAAPDVTGPEAFPTYGDDLPTAYCCPKCGYEWSGKPK